MVVYENVFKVHSEFSVQSTIKKFPIENHYKTIQPEEDALPKGCETKRMHSSRMRTDHCSGPHWERGCLRGGGVCLQGSLHPAGSDRRF